MDQAAPKFDTAEYEETLRQGGLDDKLARTHRTALAVVVESATRPLLSQKDLNMAELRLEAKMEKIANDLTWKILGGFAILNAIMIAVIKLT